MNTIFAVGPEDIGKKVYVRSVNKIGRILWFKMNEVCVLIFADRKAYEFAYDDCMYLRQEIRH